MPSKVRVERIAERIYEEVTELLLYELQDPRLTGVNVTDVNVDRELSYADIYVSALAGQERQEEALAGLQSAAGYIRGRLAKSIQLRSFPIVRFHWDITPERADRIEELLHQIREELPETEVDDATIEDIGDAEQDE